MRIVVSGKDTELSGITPFLESIAAKIPALRELAGDCTSMAKVCSSIIAEIDTLVKERDVLRGLLKPLRSDNMDKDKKIASGAADLTHIQMLWERDKQKYSRELAQKDEELATLCSEIKARKADFQPYESMKLDNIELSLDLIERAARYSSQATFIIKQI